MFDISQTEGEPLPDLDTEATGDAGDLVSQLAETADEVGVTVYIVPEEEWTHRATVRRPILEYPNQRWTYSGLRRRTGEKDFPVEIVLTVDFTLRDGDST